MTTQPATLLTIAQLRQLPDPAAALISEASRKAILDAFAEIDPGAFEEDASFDPIAVALSSYGDPTVNAIVSDLMMAAAARGPSDPATGRDQRIFAALLAAYADTGVTPPAGLTHEGLLDIFDQLPDIYLQGDDPAKGGAEGTIARATAYALVSAMSLGDFYLTYTIIDSPGGDGIGWTISRQEFCLEHGIPDSSQG